MNIWQRICLAAGVSMSMVAPSHAQSTVTPEDEYKKLIRVNQDIQPLGATPFGEQISLYNGSLSFEQTDVSLAGTGPLLQLSRSFRTIETHPDNPVGGIDGDSIDGAFSDWDLEVPRIVTNIAYHGINPGWVMAGGTPYARCSHLFSGPPTIAGWQGNNDWEPHSWWQGNQLIIPGEGSQDLLIRDPSNTAAPNGDTTSYQIVTVKNYQISCGVLTDDETNGGQGFTVLAPDGTKYTLNHLVYRWESTIDRPAGAGSNSLRALMTVHPMVAPTDYLQRQKAEMLVTRIEDRFGNSLTYSYDAAHPANLTSIAGSDGRLLTLAHDDGTQRITKATLTDAASGTSRTWQYSYDSTANSFHTLKHVILPDNTQWSYNLDLLFANMTPDTPGLECDDIAQFDPKSWVGTITHPSGLVGSFTIAPLARGRSNVTRECQTIGPGSSYAALPRVYYLPVITSKTFTGPGISSKNAAGQIINSQTWSYSYSPPNQSWSGDTCSGGPCPSTVWTDVLDPDRHDVTYTFSNRYDYSESQLKRTDYHSGDASSSVIRSESNDYAALPIVGVGTWPWPWPSQYGFNLQSRVNSAQTQELSPLVQRTIQQDGDTYYWQAETFNQYAQVTKTKRYNLIAGQSPIEETTSYRNDTSGTLNGTPRWVLGLPVQVTNVTNAAAPEVESLNGYADDDTLLMRARFGQTLMNYTFVAGQLASFTDGRGNQTTLGNYKRGIPQTIGYPDSTSETLVVDDFGQIRSVTDQLTHTTSYGYDPLGRVTGITYPAGDETGWAPQSFTYTFVTSAERGLAANHWKRTSTMGGANTVTYFDAMLRPVVSDSDIGSTVQSSALSTYDSKGQKLFSAYPIANALTFTQTPHAPATGLIILGTTTTYDALGHITQVQQDTEPTGTVELTTSTAYLTGAQQQVTDPKGNVTTTSYQVFDQPNYDRVIQVLAPTSITQTIARDAYGNPQSIEQWGPTTAKITKNLFYDGYKRLCRTAEPESHSEVLHYDAANNVDWSIAGVNLDPSDITCGYASISGGQTNRTYDAMNRVKTILAPSGTQSTTYGYDLVGRMTSAVSGNTSWIGTYNFRGMLTGESLQVGAQGPWGIGYAHDANGNLSLIHYPDGENVSYAPDALGRATQVGSYANGIDYWPNGQVAGFMFGNGTGYTSDQNYRQLLSNFSYTAGSTPQVSEDFGYDNNGNIVSVTDLAGATRNKSFGYDALNRLTSATSSLWGGTQSYTYDALNNLLTLTTGGQTATYSYVHNLLMGISGAMTASYVYDLRGNVQSKNTTTLSFDLKNQLLSIGTGSTAENFEYDAAGRRVHKSNGADTYYFYNQAGQLMYQNSPGSLSSTNFIYLGTKMVARDVNGAPTISSPANSGTGNYTVSWTGSPGATSYTLQERVNGGSFATIQNGGATVSAITGKSNGVYGYQVQACNVSTCTAWSNITSTTVLLPPAAPATITVPATSTGSVAVSWAASATATGYTLQHRLGAGGWSNAYSGAAVSTSVNETATGSYTYQVQACNASGCSAFTPSSAVVVTLPVTTAPTLTSPAISGNGSYTVSWSAVSSASTYTLQEQINGGSWSTTQSNSATSQNFTGRTAGTYGYRVQGCNIDGCGPWSSVVNTTVVYPPAAPATITVPATSTGTVAVSWSASATATSYTLQHRLGTGGWTTAYSGAATSSSVNETTTGSYTYQVQACNAGGCSAFKLSSAVAVTIPVPPQSAPALTVPASSTTGNYTVSWGSVATATSYNLQEQVSAGAWSTIQSGSALSKAITGKFSGSYGYRVQACNAVGCGPWSSTGTIIVLLPPGRPGAPSLTASGALIHASWTAVTGATSYMAEDTPAGGAAHTFYTGPLTTGSVTLEFNGQVVFNVKACNASGCSAWSENSYITLHTDL